MQDLTLVGLTEDKSKLVLLSDSGEKFTLPVDGRLRAALRGDLARLGQLETRMDSALRPRDIQARIRSGESPESVADAAQTTIDRIMTYAGPVLAERAHIADLAQRASIRRRAGEGPARILGETVNEQLRSRSVDPERVDWDAWRREDGRWTLVARFHVAERPQRAEFTFDVQGRYVVAEDDEARFLLGEQPVRRPQPPRPPSPATARRLAAVNPELPLGDDAIDLVTRPGAEPAATADEERTVDLTQTARDLRRGTPAGRPTAHPTGRPTGHPTSHPTRADELGGATGDADWMATQASGRLRAPGQDAEPESQEAVEDPRPEESAEQDHSPETEVTETPPKKTGRKGRRASVPSWDEIMFGGGRSE